MSDSEELKSVVERLLRENNVKLKELIQTVLQRIAGEFWAAGLIEKDVEESVHVTGVDKFTLAARLFNACRKSLVLYPGENFLKFIGILKAYETIKLLAEEMESEFEHTRESYVPVYNALAVTHLASLPKRIYNISKVASLYIQVC